MIEFALLVDGTFREIRSYADRPEDIQHKGVSWHPVTREYGEPFEGLENGAWVIRTIDPATLMPFTPRISFAQLMIGLVVRGWITEAEGLAWLAATALPAAVVAAINAMPEQHRFAATARALKPDYIDPDDQLVNVLTAGQNITPQQKHEFFVFCATL